ncbi:MAG: T9SS type A sorting domain-containing protein, partial [Bacteroidales bacterium]|nr:T9SS type A sorting domain-containing protein [Bacteroidales bacterium]
FDILGQQMLAKTVATGSVRFSHNLTTGLYVVTLYNGKERMASKIVVR